MGLKIREGPACLGSNPRGFIYLLSICLQNESEAIMVLERLFDYSDLVQFQVESSL